MQRAGKLAPGFLVQLRDVAVKLFDKNGNFFLVQNGSN